jgi:hypothetical protein
VLPKKKIQIETVFEVRGFRAGERKTILVDGIVHDLRPHKDDGLQVKEMVVRIHTDDGQVPDGVKIGARWPIVLVMEG